MAEIQNGMAWGREEAFQQYHRLPWEEEADAAFYQYLLEIPDYNLPSDPDIDYARESWLRFNGLSERGGNPLSFFVSGPTTVAEY